MTPQADLRARLEAIGAFADELEAADFDAGTWHDSERSDSADFDAGTWHDSERSDSADFDAGTWHDSERAEPADIAEGEVEHEGEVWTMPWFELSERAEAFVRTAAGNGWVQPFDWMAWVQTDEAKTLRDDRASLARATPDQLQRLLTAVIRADRFSDGSLEWAFDSGLMATIARRAAALAHELAVTPDA